VNSINAPEVLALIPARRGSKGIPRKNVRLLAGRPLIAHTLQQALSARIVNRVAVSTDDPEIAAISRQLGAEVIRRPAEISSDTATSESALLHAMDYLEETENFRPELVVFLQSTSPVRAPCDIDCAVEKLLASGADSLLSVVRSHYFIWRLLDGEVEPVNYDYSLRPRRQERLPEFVENGSIYVFKPWILRQLNNRLGGKIALYEMDRWSMVDIDTPSDLELCELVFSHVPYLSGRT
jgi:N-acylneuraminate cytidylyltransferase